MIINGSSTSTGVGAKRLINQTLADNHHHHDSQMIKSINLGWNTPQNGVGLGLGLASSSISVPDPNWPNPFPPPLLPSISCSLGALLSKLPSISPSPYINDASHEAPNTTTTAMLMNNSNSSSSSNNNNNNKNCAENQIVRLVVAL
ncbi:hypothetical protein M0R45_011915 [Rubus argutus]|uniref:Uncharacterized protein n=1 Tax=Rubus argutus TaxID=59490 RepID=A0AAW1YD30_RUBAR